MAAGGSHYFQLGGIKDDWHSGGQLLPLQGPEGTAAWPIPELWVMTSKKSVTVHGSLLDTHHPLHSRSDGIAGAIQVYEGSGGALSKVI
jgi:hypothetical protein